MRRVFYVRVSRRHDGRQVADFSSLPEAERCLSAAFLQRLISGSHETHGELCCPLRIRGAQFLVLRFISTMRVSVAT
jgi:hypothetical protein